VLFRFSIQTEGDEVLLPVPLLIALQAAAPEDLLPIHFSSSLLILSHTPATQTKGRTQAHIYNNDMHGNHPDFFVVSHNCCHVVSNLHVNMLIVYAGNELMLLGWTPAK
jgi:hypothetical protein